MPIRDMLNVVRSRMPKINPLIAEGLAFHQMKSAESTIDRLLQIGFRREESEWTGEGLPDGIHYLRMEPVTPEESYIQKTKANTTKDPSRVSSGKIPRGYDMSLTDTYLVKLVFDNGGELKYKYWAIPFARRGGIIHIRGTRFAISAVLKTRGLSLTQKGYFTEFNRARVIFEWLSDSFLINGDVNHVYMPYSFKLHNKAKKNKYVPALACWLFAKYGLFETFKRYLNADIKVYDADDPALLDYDTNKFAVCRPDPSHRGGRPNLAIVIDKKDLSKEAEVLIGTVFYIARENPTRVIAEYIGREALWQIMLGFAIFGRGEHEARIIEEIKAHFANIERTLDVMFKAELLSEGVECDTIYDFLFHVITRLTRRDGSELSSMANLYGRYLTTTEYVIRDMREAIFNAHWELIKQARKTGGKAIMPRNVDLILNRQLRTHLAAGISSGHGEINAFQVATDNMLIGLTCHCIDQTDARAVGAGKKKVIDLNDPSRHLHSSIAEVGSLSNLPKSSPIGYARLNPYLSIDPFGRIQQKPHLKRLLRDLDMDIRQKGVEYNGTGNEVAEADEELRLEQQHEDIDIEPIVMDLDGESDSWDDEPMEQPEED